MADPDPLCCSEDGCPSLFGAALGEPEAVELAAALKALADPVRLRILNCVAAASDGELCACDLPAALDRSQPTVSHHLTQLVSAGVLEREQRGKWAWFRIRDGRLDEIARAMTRSAPTPGN
jgi:ArsR family transcriptional regulator